MTLQLLTLQPMTSPYLFNINLNMPMRFPPLVMTFMLISITERILVTLLLISMKGPTITGSVLK